MMDKPRFSIITVCYNAETYIKETIESLLKQKYTNYEYIIKDGGSLDRTMEIVHSLVEENKTRHIIQGADKGIFDAMNIAAQKAKGEYVFFLNAGDLFYSPYVLEQVDRYIKKNQDKDIVFGDIIQMENGEKSVRIYSPICSKKIYFLTGDCICHQALFAKKELLQEKLFDLSYKVCGDKEWQLYHVTHGKLYGYVKMPISIVIAEGFSREHVEEFEEETLHVIRKYCPILVNGYIVVMKMKRNIWLRKMLRMLGKVFFQKEC